MSDSTSSDDGRLRSALHLVYIVDRDGARDWQRLEAILDAGATAIWLRAPDASGAKLYSSAHELVWRCHERDAFVIVGDRADVALAAGADGVQLGFRSPPVRKVRPWFPGWIGMSCHSREELQKAQRGGADFAVLSPIFGVPDKGGPLGTALFGQLAEAAEIPVVALGGIDGTNVERVREAGAEGIAVIRALRDTESPESAAQVLSAAMTPR